MERALTCNSTSPRLEKCRSKWLALPRISSLTDKSCSSCFKNSWAGQTQEPRTRDGYGQGERLEGSAHL